MGGEHTRACLIFGIGEPSSTVSFLLPHPSHSEEEDDYGVCTFSQDVVSENIRITSQVRLIGLEQHFLSLWIMNPCVSFTLGEMSNVHGKQLLFHSFSPHIYSGNRAPSFF